ncbi:hypothetical protein [Hymenobacter coccineus]|uniref:Uncharacterized protein n=1 Tax=Hymenobacter coccineus TaxID=1908235 RepID=A0A1G1TH96_9BACT|nr:hypothetical protein [Hymenobacter coccineus]OGX90173.1 hypothetical protein BEN49_07420 [Hymenobacter coccineus]
MPDHLRSFVTKLCALPPRATALPPQPLNVPALYSVLFNRELEAQTGAVVYKQASQLAAQYHKAVQACRQQDLAGALAHLLTVDAALTAAARAGLPAVATDFVTLFRLSAWGNYYYKANKAARAVEILRQGLGLSAALERQGYPVFIYRRIEQLQNIATIYFQQQQYDLANTLIKNTLNFVHSGRVAGLFIDDWDAATFRSMRLIQESTLDEGFGRLAKQNTQLMGHATYGNAYYCQTFFQDLLQTLETDTYNRAVLYNWLYVKVAYHEQGPDAFYEYALSFFSDANIAPQYDGLKANLLAQAVWEVKQHAPRDRQELMDAIRHFSLTNLLEPGGQPLKLAA